MPGIYINDGGATSNALAGAIAKIADNYNPKTREEAHEMRLRQEGLNYDNQLKSVTNPAIIGGINAAGGLPDLYNANPQAGGVVKSVTNLATPPTMSAGGGGAAYQGTTNAPNSAVGAGAPTPSVANTVAGYASPATQAQAIPVTQGDPGGSGGPETMRGGFTPGRGIIPQMLQSRFAQGATMQEMRQGIDMGQELTMGPGHTMEDQRLMEIERQKQELSRSAPLTLHPHETWISNPMAPGAGGAGGGAAPATPAAPDGTGAASPTPGVTQNAPVVIHGPGGVEIAGEERFGAEAATQMAKLAEEGSTAGQQQVQLHDMLEVYNRVVKEGGVSLQDAGVRAAVKAIADRYGLGNIDLTQTDQVKTILDAQLLQMMGNMRQRTGQVGAMSDRDMELLRKTIADPTRSTAVFLGVAQAMDKALAQSAEAGRLALSYRPEMDSATIQNLRGQLAKAIANADAGGMVKQMFPDLGWDPPQQGGGGTPEGGSGGGGTAPRILKIERVGP